MNKHASGGSDELQPYEWEGREEYLTRLLSHLQYGETGSPSHLEAMRFLQEFTAAAIQQLADGLVENKLCMYVADDNLPKHKLVMLESVPVHVIQAAAKEFQEGK